MTQPDVCSATTAELTSTRVALNQTRMRRSGRFAAVDSDVVLRRRSVRLWMATTARLQIGRCSKDGCSASTAVAQL